MKHHQPLSAHSDLVAGGTQQSGDDGKEILEHALASFQSTLYDEERVRLQRMKGSPCDAGSIIQFTHELDRCDSSRKGKSIATTLHSLLQGVEQFYQIADTYVSSHPEIAALVWGSVKLAFMILSNFTSYFQRFSELLRGFDQLIPRFSEYRRLFPNSNRLRLATYGFQTAIIRCCSQIVLATRRPWKQQLLAALSQSFQTEMRPLVDDIRASAKRVMEEVELAQAQATHQEQVLQSQERQMAGKSRREVSRWFAKSDKDIQKLRQKELARAKEYKWDALLEKLSRYDHAAAFKSARAKRHNGTAEWVLHTPEFETWYHNNSSVILHLVGKIGAGKTILTANVVDHLILSRTHDQAIAFFFVRFDDQTSQHSECILRSLIRQAFNHTSADDELLQRIEDSHNRYFDNESLMTLWSERVKSFKELFLVLDGLDECTLAERRATINSLSKLIEDRKMTTRVKVFISSRSSIREEIHQMNATVLRVALDERNINPDLNKYAKEILEEKIAAEDLILQDESLFESILETVGAGGEGMFLWVSLTIDDICSRTSDSEIRESLEHIPRELFKTFDRALQRITNNGKAEIAQDIFNWTATVRLPLTLDQLREALAIRIGQRHSEPERYLNGINRLTSWCENLVHVDEIDETVRFSHHSIRQYILMESETFHVESQDWEHHVGEICLTYLDFNDFKKALVERNGTKSMDISNYPAAIATETAQTLLPSVKKEKILTSFQRLVQKSKRHSAIFTPQVNAHGTPLSVLTAGYPFFQYAANQWIFHTTTFQSHNTQTWDLWRSMIRNELISWMGSNWEPRNSPDYEDKPLPPGGFANRQHLRETDVLCHKAILLAQFTGHRTLMEELFSFLRQNDAHLSRGLLKMLMLPGQILIGSNSPISLTLTEADIHTNILDIISQYIAVGGRLEVSDLTDHEKCNLKSIEEHRSGISHDVCFMLCTGRSISVNRKWMQLSAQVSVSDLNDDLFQRITDTLMNSHILFESRTVKGKTILNLIIERDVNWWLALSDWMSNNLRTWLTVNTLMKDSLRFSLKFQDEISVDLLMRARHIDWTDKGIVDHGLVRCATAWETMTRGLRKQFIRSVINSTHSSQVATEIRKRERIRIGKQNRLLFGPRRAQVQLLPSMDSTERENEKKPHQPRLGLCPTECDPLYYYPNGRQKRVAGHKQTEHEETESEKTGSEETESEEIEPDNIEPEGVETEEIESKNEDRVYVPEETEFEKQKRLYSISIVEAAQRSYWDIAVALYEHRLGLVPTAAYEKHHIQAICEAFDCILRVDVKGELGNSCYLTDKGIRGMEITYCDDHTGTVGRILDRMSGVEVL